MRPTGFAPSTQLRSPGVRFRRLGHLANHTALLEAAVSFTSNGLVITDPNLPGNPIVFANDAFLHLTGFEREEELGASFRSLMTRGAGSDALAEIEAAFAGRADSEPEICYRRGEWRRIASMWFRQRPANSSGCAHCCSGCDHNSSR